MVGNVFLFPIFPPLGECGNGECTNLAGTIVVRGAVRHKCAGHEGWRPSPCRGFRHSVMGTQDAFKLLWSTVLIWVAALQCCTLSRQLEPAIYLYGYVHTDTGRLPKSGSWRWVHSDSREKKSSGSIFQYRYGPPKSHIMYRD